MDKENMKKSNYIQVEFNHTCIFKPPKLGIYNPSN